MPTIASSAPPQRPPPGDADLQELYDQVLSAFADESSPSTFSPTYSISMSNNLDYEESVYSPHSDDVASPASSRPHPQSHHPNASSLDNNNYSLPSPTTFSTSPVGKGPRPLPRLPGSSPNVSSHYPTHMPDPHIVHEPSPPVSTGSKPHPEQCVTLNILPISSRHPCV
jgi:hypothetical protein